MNVAPVLSSDLSPREHLFPDRRDVEVALLDAIRVVQDREGAHQPGPFGDSQIHILGGCQRSVLDGTHAQFQTSLHAEAPVRMSRRVGSTALGLLDDGGDLGVAVADPVHAHLARHAAGCEQLQEVGARLQVLAGPAPYRVGSVREGERTAVPIAGGERPGGDHQPGAGYLSSLDGLAYFRVQEMLFPHDPRRRDARAQHPTDIAHHPKELARSRLHHLAGLVPSPGMMER